MSYEIVQGKITHYSDKSKRICSVLQIPDHYLIREVRLPRTLMSQSLPQEGSFVLVASEGSYKGFVIAVLREPLEFIGNSETSGLRASSPFDQSQLQPGEVFLESRGDPAAPIPGFGATFFMGNDGTISLHSGKRKESIMIGGTDDDEDGEIVITADNGFFESNVNEITQMRSTVRFDEDNTITIGNMFSVIGVALTETPICELTMDTLGDITLRNTTLGVDKATLNMSPVGEITLENTIANLTISPIGNITLENAIAQFNAASSGAITIDGTTINLNNGAQGVARINDATIINALSDPAFMAYLALLDTFMNTLFLTFNLHGHTGVLNGGGVTGPPITPLIIAPPSSPTSITSRISTGSATVKAGG